MPVNDFIKRIEADLDEQEGNFSIKFSLRAGEVGIDISEVTSVNNVLNNHHEKYTEMILKKAEAKAAVAANRKAKTDAIKELRRISKKIKYSNGYTVSLGKDLGIVGPEISKPDTSTLQPKLKAIVTGDVIRLVYKKGKMHGVKIFCKRSDETTFGFLDENSISPYTDKRPKLGVGPEERQYFARFMYKDKVVGKDSDIVTVVLP